MEENVSWCIFLNTVYNITCLVHLHFRPNQVRTRDSEIWRNIHWKASGNNYPEQGMWMGKNRDGSF